MKKNGVVKSVVKDKVTITTYKKTSCGKCHVCTESNDIEKEYELKTDLQLKKGDIVSFEISDKKILGYSFLIYIIPIFGFFFGYYFIYSFIQNSSEGQRILGSFGGMILIFLIVFALDKYFSKNILKNIKIDKI